MLRGSQGVLGTGGAVLLGMGNGLRRLTDLLHRRQLRLQALGQVLDGMGHPGRGQRVVAGMPRQAAAEFDEIGSDSLFRGGSGIVTALPGTEPRPQRQQQEGRHADVGRQLHLLVDQHQRGQPQGVKKTGNG